MQNNMQQVVLFDKKFVADSVREILKCSICRCPFSANYEVNRATNRVKGNRPVLLPCAHSVCENCIQQNIKKLACPECARPVEIPAHILEEERHHVFKFRTLFQINFYLMGVLRDLNYYRSTDLVSNSSVLQNSDASRQASQASFSVPHCNECDTSMAAGKCETCGFYFCKPCYAKIHDNNKVFKSHKLIYLDKISKGALPYLPKPEFCRMHRNKACDQYCKKCDLIICYNCAKTDHKGHGYLALERRNAGYADAVFELFDAVKQTTEQVRKAQREIKSVEYQFQEYASKTLEEIAQYFWEMHGLLQLEFRQIMQNFSESCQDPQKQIRAALQELNKSQLELSGMKNALETIKEKVPTHVDLGAVNRKLNEKLINMRCQVAVIKPRENPFVFQKQGDFKRQLKNLYMVQYVQPQFSISLSACYGGGGSQQRNTPITLQPYLCNNNSYADNSIMQQSMASDENHDLAAAAAVNSDESKENIVANFVKQPKQQQQKYEEIVARVSHSKSPTYFFVQKDSVMKKLEPLWKKYTSLESTSHMAVQSIQSRELYVGYQEQNQQQKWHRIAVFKDLGNDKFKAKLVDVGCDMEIAKHNIRKLDGQFKDIEYAAIHCGLFNIEPKIGANWPTIAKELFLDVLRGKPLRVIKICEEETGVWGVDLLTNLDDYAISVRESFFYMGLAREKPGLVKMPSSLQKIYQQAPPKQRLSQIQLVAGQIFKVEVCHIENPTEFYVVYEEDVAKKHELKLALNKAYTNVPKSGKNAKCLIHLGLINMACAVYYEEMWHRGCIEEIEENGKVRVRFVDEGNAESLKWNKLFHLFEQFRQQKKFAIRCSLDDIEPFREDNYTWNERAIDEFKQLAKNPNIRMTVTQTLGGVPKVMLTSQKKNNEINIGVTLVRRNLALSTGPSTQLDANTVNGLSAVAMKQNEQIAMCLADNADQLINKSAGLSAQVPRTLVTVTHIVNPGEFYLWITKLEAGIVQFLALLQDATEKRIDDAIDSESFVWSLGDRCLVHTTSNSSQLGSNELQIDDKSTVNDEYKWYRGVIIKITMEQNEMLNGDESFEKFSVFLRDIGSTVEVTRSQLYTIDYVWDGVADTAVRCHLAGIQPTAGGATNVWSMSATDMLRSNVKQQPTVLASLLGELVDGSLPIVLWGMTIEAADPLAPSLPKYANINRILVALGLAKLTQLSMKNAQCLEMYEKETGLDEVLQKFAGGSFLEAIERCVAAQPEKEIERLDDEMISVGGRENYAIEGDAIKDFLRDIDTVPTWGKHAPKAWLRSKIIFKTVFTGSTTYVDYDAIIYLHDSCDQETLDLMRKTLLKAYENANYDSSRPYSLGQPCVARYHLDKCLYRGIITAFDNRTEEYSVKFIDYGNVEQIKGYDLLPFAPFPKLQAYASRYRCECIAPLDGAKRFSENVLDAMHMFLVNKLAGVRVRPAETRKKVQYCSLRVGPDDLAEFMVSTGRAALRNNARLPKKVRAPPMANYLEDIEAQDLDQLMQQADDDYMDETEGDIESDTTETGDGAGDGAMDADAEANRCVDELLNVMSTTNDENRMAAYMELQPEATDFQRLFEANVQGPVGFEYFNNFPQDYIDEDDMIDAVGAHDNALICSGNHAYNEIDNDVLEELEESIIHSWKEFSDVTRGRRTDYNNDDNKDQGEREMAMEWNQIKRLRQAKSTASSDDYEQFTPNECSTSMSSIAEFENIRWPTLPSNVGRFTCTIHAVVSPTMLHVFPLTEQFIEDDLLLREQCQHLAKMSPLLAKFTPNTLCLARYSSDQQWYRGVIKAYSAETYEAKVLFIDYWNSEMVPIKQLKAFPPDLRTFSLRTLKVQLYGVKPSPRMRTSDIMQAVRKAVKNCQEPYVQIVQQQAEEPKTSDDPYLVHMFVSENAPESLFQDLVDQKYFVATK